MKEGAICLRDAVKDEGRAPRRARLNLWILTSLSATGAMLPLTTVAQTLPPPESYAECTQATNAFLIVYGAGMTAEALVYSTHAVDLCKTQKGERYPDTMIIRIAWVDHA